MPWHQKVWYACKVDGCARIDNGSRGYCKPHYQRHLRYGDATAGKPLKPAKPARYCDIPDCNRPHAAHGLCHAHYMRNYLGSTSVGPFKTAKGKYKNPEGYIVLIVDASTPGATKIKGNTGIIMEHRFIVQKALGRPLRKEENIHHLNGIKDDNRIENLELWVRSQPSGQRAEDLVAWAEEILGRYGHLSPATFGRKAG
jgi:HNH endonuclease